MSRAAMTRGDAVVGKGIRARTKSGQVTLAAAINQPAIALTLGVAAYAYATGQWWRSLTLPLIAAASAFDLSRLSWDPRSEGPIAPPGQLAVRGNLLWLFSSVSLVLLPTGWPLLPGSLAVSALLLVIVRARVLQWEPIAARHAPGRRLLRSLERMRAERLGAALQVSLVAIGATALGLGVPAALYATALALVGVALCSHGDRARDALEVAARRALAGLFLSGGPWDPRLADAGTAPVTVRAVRGHLLEVAGPLTPAWQSDQTARLRVAVAERLSRWGDFEVAVDPVDRCWRAAPMATPPAVPWSSLIPNAAKVSHTMHTVPVGINLATKATWTMALAQQHLLVGGVPGSGKSAFLNCLLASLAGLPEVQIVAIDRKRGVEFAPWAPRLARLATNLTEAEVLLGDLRRLVDKRYDWLAEQGARNAWEPPFYGCPEVAPLVVVIDEAQLVLASAGPDDKQSAAARVTAVTELVLLARAVGVVIIIATQKPLASAIPTDIRDNVQVRLAFATTTDASTDVILGSGSAAAGADPKRFNRPTHRGCGLVASEGVAGWREVRSGFLTDDEVVRVAAATAHLRSDPWAALGLSSMLKAPAAGPVPPAQVKGGSTVAAKPVALVKKPAPAVVDEESSKPATDALSEFE